MATASNLLAGNYTVTITDANACTTISVVTIANTPGVGATIPASTPPLCNNSCDGTATALATGGASPYKYTWSGGVISTTSLANNLCSGTYSVTITDANNCNSTSSVVITAPSAFKITPVVPDTVCIGQLTNLSVNAIGGTPTYTINWMPGSLQGTSINVSLASTATYSISATDGNGCPASNQTITLNVRKKITADITGPTAVCGVGKTINLKASATGGDNIFSYTWLTNPNSNGSTLSTIVNTPQTYSVVVNDGCGTPADTIPYPVAIIAAPTVGFTPSITSGCPSLCVDFTDTSKVVGNDSIVSWNWNLGGVTSTKQNPSNCFSTGKYNISLTVTTGDGCSSSITKNQLIDVYAQPTAAFSVNPENATVIYPEFNFYNESSNDATNFLWNFNDTANSTSTAQNPSFTYQSLGTYCPQLTIANSNGCKDSIKHCIVYGEDYAFYIPNSFTPNNDGKNDTFSGKGIGIKTYKMLIFDRWGELIYSTNDINLGWDGTVNEGSHLAQQDVYSYQIQIVDVFNQQHQYIGKVTLLK